MEGRYRGEIVTDFDQLSPRFGKALFSLDEILSSNNPAQLWTKVADGLEQFGNADTHSELGWISGQIRRQRASARQELYAKTVTIVTNSPGANVVSGSQEVRIATGGDSDARR